MHEHADYFGRTISEIARHLYVNAWVVGSGKTIGIPVAAWAINQILRTKLGSAARRVDRILVITKDQAIRDQIAFDLGKDLVRYNIVRRAPRVGVVTEGTQFKQTAWLDSHDVIITCEQQLWESNGSARTDLAKILAEFPMIAFDEPHYATDQIAKIVDTATSSLCIGFTGTPVDRCGVLLSRMVWLTVYDYQSAIDIDRSLKYLDNEDDHFPWFVREIEVIDAVISERGQDVTTQDTAKQGYEKAIEVAKAVVRGVVEEVKGLDEVHLADEQLALHRRQQKDVEMSLLYPAHGLVFFDHIAVAEALAENTNQIFEADRINWPADRGWRVEVVDAGGRDRSGKQRSPKPLARQKGQKAHPWVYCHQNNGKLDDYCARILFVVDMAREGVNNPYCAVVGVACSTQSLLDAVQGWLGRQLRAVTRLWKGRFQVPPRPLDTVRIITHQSYMTTSTIKRGIFFICEMRQHLDALPKIEDIENGELKSPKEIEREISVPLREKIEIAGFIEEHEQAGDPICPSDVLKVFAPDGGKRAERITEWVGK